MTEEALDPRDEDRLPWLEAVEEDEEEGVSLIKLIAGVLAVLLLIALVIGGIFWLGGNRGNTPDGAEIIAAPEEDYRVRPSEAGGMEVEGEGDAAFAASEGESPEGRIDRDATPEEPVQGRRVAEAEETPSAGSSARIPASNRTLAEDAPRQAADSGTSSSTAGNVGASSGRLIQLGAFSSEAAANRAWTQISGAHSALGSLSKTVTPVQAGGRTLYRLRAAAASADAARSLCARLRDAGQACSVVVN